MTRSILIVDDHAGFRRAARAMLVADGFDVVGEAADGATGIAQVERLRPAVVLLDIQLPDIDGFAVAQRLASLVQVPAIILISSRDRGDYAASLATSPAVGFIAKSSLSGAAVEALLG